MIELLLAATLSWTNTCSGAVPALSCAFELERFDSGAWVRVLTTPPDVETVVDPDGDVSFPYRIRAVGAGTTLGVSVWAYSAHQQLPGPVSITVTFSAGP